MRSRYAIYYAPPTGSQLDNLGRRWFEAAADERLAELTRDPRRYGFHGTLKPPFRIAADQDPGRLRSALADFARGRRAIAIPPLRLAVLGTFIALVPSAPCPPLDALAADCLRHFDAFRAPPDDAELARRRAAGLSARQEALLQRWGYPYVLQKFRFHLTLTGRVPDADERQALFDGLQGEAAEVCRDPLPIGEICLFVQPDPEAGFTIAERFVLAGSNHPPASA